MAIDGGSLDGALPTQIRLLEGREFSQLHELAVVTKGHLFLEALF